MKTVLLLLAVSIFIISCDDGNKSKTETTATDSTKFDTTAKQLQTNCDPGDRNSIEYWKIDSATFSQMQINNGHSGFNNSSVRDSNKLILKSLKDSFKGDYVGPITARYRPEDTARYRSHRCIAPGDSAGMVEQHQTWVIKVKVKKAGAQISSVSYDYYDIFTICPPPDCSQVPIPLPASAK